MVFESEYENTSWISPNSNAVERLFSRAKLILTPKRMAMLPLHLEIVLFLHCNRSFWNDQTIQEMFASQKEAADDECPGEVEEEDPVREDDFGSWGWFHLARSRSRCFAKDVAFCGKF